MISSRQNKTLKDIRRLRRSKERGRVLLEGPHLVGEALAAGIGLELVLATPELAAREPGASLLRRLEAAGHAPTLVEPALLAEGADADSPRGILAVATLERGGAASLPRVADGLYVFADGVQDPGNLGAISRVAEATGAVALACGPGTAHPNHPRALRASAGSLLRLPLAVDVTPAALVAHLAPLAPTAVGLVAHGGSDLWSTHWARPLVLLLGSEGGGLGEESLAVLDERVEIPLRAPVESLNVATAAAVALFELSRRR